MRYPVNTECLANPGLHSVLQKIQLQGCRTFDVVSFTVRLCHHYQLANSKEVDQGWSRICGNMTWDLTWLKHDSMMDMRQTVSANYRFKWNPTLPELMHPKACAWRKLLRCAQVTLSTLSFQTDWGRFWSWIGVQSPSIQVVKRKPSSARIRNWDELGISPLNAL